MKKLLLIFIFLLQNNIYADKISLVSDVWIPYTNKKNARNQGYIIEIATLIFNKAGHSIEYHLIPWKNALLLTQKGIFTAICGASKRDNRHLIYPTEEIGIDQSAFYVKKDNPWRYKGISSLKNLRVGLIKDYYYNLELDNFFKKNKQIPYYGGGKNPLIYNISLLKNNRLNTILENTNVMSYHLKSRKLENDILHAGNVNNKNNIYIAFSPKNKKSEEYSKILSDGIKELKNSGQLDSILKKYGLNYWK